MNLWTFFQFSKVLKIIDYNINSGHWFILEDQEQTRKNYSFHISSTSQWNPIW